MELKTKQNKLCLDEMMAENYYPVNITMVKYLGIEAALFFSALYEEMDFMRADLLKYNTFSIRTAREKTGLTPAKQKKAIEVLKRLGLIDVYIQPGYPKVRKIKFNLSLICEFYEELKDFRCRTFLETDEAKRKFKEKVRENKEEYLIKKNEEHQKKENEYLYQRFPELRELTDDPSSYVMENKEWFYKVYFTNLKPQEPIRPEDLPF